MGLFIKTLGGKGGGKTIMLEVEPTDTILQVKQKIEQNEGIPVSEQIIILSGKECKNDTTVNDHQFQMAATVHLIRRQLVQPAPAKNKSQVPKKSELKPREKKGNSLQLFVKTPSGVTERINVYTDDTIAHVKEEVSRKTNIPIEKLRLLFQGKQLDSDRQVSDYNMQKESTIHAVNPVDLSIEKKPKSKEQKKNMKLVWRVGNFNPMKGDDDIEQLECWNSIQEALVAYGQRQVKNIKNRTKNQASIQAVEVDLDEIEETDSRQTSEVHREAFGVVYKSKPGRSHLIDFKVLAFFNQGSADLMDVDVEPDSPQTRVDLNAQLFDWAGSQQQAVAFLSTLPSAPPTEMENTNDTFANATEFLIENDEEDYNLPPDDKALAIEKLNQLINWECGGLQWEVKLRGEINLSNSSRVDVQPGGICIRFPHERSKADIEKSVSGFVEKFGYNAPKLKLFIVPEYQRQTFSVGRGKSDVSYSACIKITSPVLIKAIATENLADIDVQALKDDISKEARNEKRKVDFENLKADCKDALVAFINNEENQSVVNKHSGLSNLYWTAKDRDDKSRKPITLERFFEKCSTKHWSDNFWDYLKRDHDIEKLYGLGRKCFQKSDAESYQLLLTHLKKLNGKDLQSEARASHFGLK
jgi:hypothetical protein